MSVKDVLAGFEYLHNHNIAHRDLKPSNSLVCNKHVHGLTADEIAFGNAYKECPIVCRLTDFGLSRGVNTQNKSKINYLGCGTRLYIAPAVQLNQLASARFKACGYMWSLHVSCYACYDEPRSC